jgi:uncharacterized membrane protein
LTVNRDTSTYQRAAELPLILLLGGVSYYTLELLWRGYSHPAMALCGAFCLWRLWRLECDHSHLPLPLRALLGSGIITVTELFAGCLLNLGLGLAIWDYTDMPLNFLGQICLPYSVLWFLLCFPVSVLLRLLRRAVFPCK